MSLADGGRDPAAAARERGVDSQRQVGRDHAVELGRDGPAVEVIGEHGLDISGHENRQ